MTVLAGVLEPRQRCAAQAVAGHMADELVVPPPPEPGDDRSPSSPRWRGQSLSKGAAGIGVLHGVRAHAGLGSWPRVQAWLACAAREDLSAGAGAGLWYGAPAVAFALYSAAPAGQYRRARQALDAAVTRLVQARLQAAGARMDALARPSLAEFDLVRGLAGLGAYLLQREPHGDLLRRVLDYLVRLTEPLPAADPAGVNAPGWWTNDVPFGASADAFAGGYADLAMAHGICGPLALMALSIRQGITVAGQVEAIGRICDWLDAWRQDGPAGPWWPERISLPELRSGRSAQRGPARPSWCYGIPGLARAQQLAGQATGDHARQQMAEQALARCLADPTQLARFTDPALCHGWAGLVLTACHAAADARSAEISACLPQLVDTLLNQVAAGGPQSFWPLTGLIEGTAGIALTLHTLAAGTNGGWARCLLVA